MPARVPPMTPLSPSSTPSGLDPRALQAFKSMMKACGKTVFRMPTSCELFLRQHLKDFPTEQELLRLALRAGVPDHVMAYNRPDGYDAFLAELSEELAGLANIPPAQSRWAVEAWATGLGRPPGTALPPPIARVVEPPPDAAPELSPAGVRGIMGLIAAAGGFVGGALGNGGGLMVIFLTSTAVDARHYGKAVGLGEVAIFLIIAVLMLLGGVGAGLGAFAGWMFGRGDQKPWAGFSAACGAAFGTGCLCFFCLGPGLLTAICMSVSAFGAAFTAASRGGFK